ncbi:MAG: autotransporter-associated beta strand repeat-containing protein, partial [Akkermansia sp.]
ILGGTLEFAPQAQATAIAIDGKITGAGNLVKSGAGTLTLSVANDYAGTTSINGGTLTLTGAGSLGGGNILLAGASAGQAVLNLIAANTIANNVTIGEGKFGTLTGWNTASTGTITLESNATHDGALILGAGQHLKLTGAVATTPGSKASVNGALTLTGSTLDFLMDRTTDTAKWNALTVNGALTLNGGISANIDSIGTRAFTDGEIYTLVTATSIAKDANFSFTVNENAAIN